ncbi:hypothetical protein [Aeromicrobium sp.]|uniref:hypothetical protein n=1 Tax=Aeromicrobium sp. TaxID=1871063 RepID=UPI0035171DC9
MTATDVVDAVERIADVVEENELGNWARELRVAGRRLADDDTRESRGELRRLLGTGHQSAGNLYVVHPDGTPDVGRSRRHTEDVAIAYAYATDRPWDRWVTWMGGIPKPPRSPDSSSG